LCFDLSRELCANLKQVSRQTCHAQFTFHFCKHTLKVRIPDKGINKTTSPRQGQGNEMLDRAR
jgi:hypothetical protein